jgi:hypothetical protein
VVLVGMVAQWRKMAQEGRPIRRNRCETGISRGTTSEHHEESGRGPRGDGGAVAQDGTSGRIDAGAVGADVRVDLGPVVANVERNYAPSSITSAASFRPACAKNRCGLAQQFMSHHC